MDNWVYHHAADYDDDRNPIPFGAMEDNNDTVLFDKAAALTRWRCAIECKEREYAYLTAFVLGNPAVPARIRFLAHARARLLRESIIHSTRHLMTVCDSHFLFSKTK
jgi:hypothetical protein